MYVSKYIHVHAHIIIMHVYVLIYVCMYVWMCVINVTWNRSDLPDMYAHAQGHVCQRVSAYISGKLVLHILRMYH